MLHEYLESANGRNAKFLEWLRKEGICRHMLSVLNEMGAVLAQTKPIGSSSILLAGTVVLVKAHGTASYSVEAMQEADKIQQLQARDVQMQYFSLQQPQEEAE